MPDSTASAEARRAQWAREVRARLASLRLTPTREMEIVDELSQHLEDRYADLTSAGAPPDEAVRLALADFRSRDVLAGRMASLRQARAGAPPTLAAPTGHVLRDLWQDTSYAVRVFLKHPAFAATAVLMLALGIGATASIFSVVYGVLLKPLPFVEPDRLVSLRQRTPLVAAGVNQGPATFLTYRENQQAFEAIGAWDPAQVSIIGNGTPERVQALLVSASILPLLRVPPHIGRSFEAEDDTPGAALHVILTHGYWQRRFGGVDTVLGKTLVIDGRPAEVIGVLPRSFAFLGIRPEILLPLPLDVSAPRTISFGFQGLGRLKPGTSIAQANADLARMIGLLPQVFARLELQPDVRPLADEVIGDVGAILWILLAAVGIVLVIACANVANLFLVRAEARQLEIAVRAALGASRARIARTLLTESLLLALAGGAVGVGLAQAATGLLRWIAPAQLPRLDEIGIDVPVVLFTFAASVLSGVLFGVFAVAQFGTPSLAAARDGGRSSTDAPARHRIRNALVVGQVALALTLLIVSGLMIRTFVAMRQVSPGFTHPEEVQTFVIAIPDGLISDDGAAARRFESVAARLAAVPGVSSVGLSSSITMDGEDNRNWIEVEGVPLPPPNQNPPTRRYKSFAPGYFETMGNRLVAGRSITWSEIHERRPLVVISETLARAYWSDPTGALGKRLRAYPGAPWCEIVGVVGDERDDGLNHPPTAIVYWPMLNEDYRWRTMAFAVRSSRVGSAGFLHELEQAVWSVDANLPLARAQTLAEIQDRSMAQTSFALVMLGIAASVALLLGVVGIYGVVAYAAGRRTREIGVRMALGARAGDVRTLFLRQGLALTATGIALGIGVAAALTRVMSAFLFGVDPIDPATYVTVSIILTATALLATYLPARRASRVNPIIALRADV
jgi:putative ABC transport system permease protein